MTIYTDKFIPQPHAAYTVGPVIFIRPAYKDDRGLLEHEKVHVRQFYQGRWFSGAGTLVGEVEAYQEQLKWYPDDRTALFASYLTTRYGFNLTQGEAEALLRKQLPSAPRKDPPEPPTMGSGIYAPVDSP